MNKKLKNRRPFKAPLVIVAIIVLLLGFGLYRTRNNSSDSTPSIPGPSSVEIQEDSKVNTEIKKQLIESPPSTAEDAPANDTTSATDKLEITAKKESNNTVTVITKLYGYSSGNCELQINNAGKATAQKAQVIYQAEYSTCAGFTVPVDSVGTGTWTITLNVTSGGTPSTTSIKEVIN